MILRLRAGLDRIQAWVWVSLLLAAGLMALFDASLPRSVPGAVEIERAVVEGPLGSPVATRKSVDLPHVWDDESPPWRGEARYEVTWPTDLPRGPLSLYIPRIGSRFRVWLNGELVAAVHWDTEGYVDTSVEPHLVDIPPSIIAPQAADNRLVIEVRGLPLRRSGLSQISIGPRDALDARYDQVYAWQISATWMLAACSAMVGLLAGLIWRQSRERAFAYLAAASVAWAIRLAITPLEHPPMPFAWWFYLHKLGISLYCGFIYLFIWDLFGHHDGRLRMLGTGVLWVGPVWLAVTTLSGSYELFRIWSGVLALVGLTALSLMFHRARWGLDQNQRLLLVAGVVTMLCGIRDFLVVQLGWPGDADLRWMPLGGLVFTLMLAAAMVERMGRYVLQISQLNQALEHRVRERENELRAAFDRLREAERRQVLEDERRRLTRDMHDGVGSQLVQALNLVRSSGVADPAVVIEMLNYALQELRMTLDSLEPLEGDLPAILGMLRRRIAPALDAAGIELDWQVEEVPPLHGLDSRGVMHLFRCLQEVFANIIRHAQARHVSVRTWVEDGRVMLAVCDDGVGIGAGFREGGRGVSNIRLRAAAIQASVQFCNANPGTCIEFRFLAEPAAQTGSAPADSLPD